MDSHLFSPQRDDISFLFLQKSTGWYFQTRRCFQRLEPCIIYYLVVHLYIYISSVHIHIYIYRHCFFPLPPQTVTGATNTSNKATVSEPQNGWGDADYTWHTWRCSTFCGFSTRQERDMFFFCKVSLFFLRDDLLITGKNKDFETFWPKLSTLFIVQVWSSITTAMWLAQHRNIGGKNTKQCSLQTCWGHPTLNIGNPYNGC